MRITTKGQVTIPQHIREKLGIPPATEVEFVEENGIGAAYPRCYLESPRWRTGKCG